MSAMSTPPPPPSPPQGPPPEGPPPAAAPYERQPVKPRRSALKVLLTVLLVLGTVAGVGYYAYLKLGREAASPTELADQFDEAGVTCTDYNKLLDLTDTKSLWCATTDGKAITTTTYVETVDVDQWISNHCAATTGAGTGPSRGAVVAGDTWTVDVQRLVRRGPTAKRVADDLSGVIGGEVTTYRCPRVG